jgi:hypothetical protein
VVKGFDLRNLRRPGFALPDHARFRRFRAIPAILLSSVFHSLP